MKKTVSFLIIGVLLCTVVCSSAENPQKFDHTVLAGREGYQYDKFDKTWQYVVELMLENDDTTGMIFVFATGGTTYLGGSLICAVMNNNQIQTCEKAMILLDEEIITIESVDKHGRYNYLLLEDKEIINRIIQAESISIRLISDNSKYDFEVSGKDMNLFGQKVNVLIENNFFESLEPGKDQTTSMFTIE